MKKYLFSALALPLLFACSDELIEKPVASNDPYPGIEKVNATFYMDEEPITRMDNGTGWTLANGDLYGFAWMTDKYDAMEGDALVPITGSAFQNHNLIQKNGRFEPQTSIYVGKYYIYRPYDETTVSPQAINFNSLKEQPMAKGFESTTDAWKKLAESAIIIADKWTDIDPAGRTYQKEDGSNDETIWNQPGIAKPYKVFAAFFSNQTGLDLTYENNNPTFDNAQNVKGATDIDYDIAAGESAGAADIYGATVQLAGAANAFTYAPIEEPNDGVYPQEVNGKTVYHNSEFWADKTKDNVEGFNFAQEIEPITLTAPASAPIGTGAEGSKGFFWFNSLPVTSQDAATAATQVVTTIKTSYGTVTIGGDDARMTLGDCAYAWDKISGEYQWIKLTDDADVTNKAKGKNSWNIANHNTFVNQFGNHKGKYSLDVDFSTAVMDIHIVDDNHLQKYLKFYMASGKQDAVELVLDGDNDKSFKLSKLSIAMLQTINRGAEADKKVLVKACDVEDHNAPANGKVKIIVTQDGQSASLAAKKEVPTLNDVFAEPTPVFLAAIDWTWGGNYDWEGTEDNEPLTIDENVASLTNLGNITVNASNIELSEVEFEEGGAEQPTIYNAKGATMTLTKVTTVKSTLNNLGTINVPANTELRAYGIDITNDAKTILMPEDIIAKSVPADGEVGIINNSGVVGVSEGTNGQFLNYGGMIYMQTDEAMTFLTSNELKAAEAASAFATPFNAENNKMGVVVLPNTTDGKYAIVSVQNKPETGFITYEWTATTYEHDPGNVKYNTIVVSNDITFQGDVRASEIQFIMFNGTKTKVVNPGNPIAASRLDKLKGVIVPDGKSFILEKTNRLNCQVGAFVGEGATIYRGGVLDLPENATNNYFDEWTLDQIVAFE